MFHFCPANILGELILFVFWKLLLLGLFLLKQPQLWNVQLHLWIQMIVCMDTQVNYRGIIIWGQKINTSSTFYCPFLSLLTLKVHIVHLWYRCFLQYVLIKVNQHLIITYLVNS